MRIKITFNSDFIFEIIITQVNSFFKLPGSINMKSLREPVSKSIKKYYFKNCVFSSFKLLNLNPKYLKFLFFNF